MRSWPLIIMGLLSCAPEQASPVSTGQVPVVARGTAGASGSGTAGASAAMSVAGRMAPASTSRAGASGSLVAGAVGAAAGMIASAGGAPAVATVAGSSSAAPGTGGMGASGSGALAGSSGRAGEAAAAGAAGVAPAAMSGMPSPGCAKATARPANGLVSQSDRIYSFPSTYDGKTPMPLLLGLHAAGNPNTQIQNLTKGSRLETDYVRVFPKSAGSAWVYNTDHTKVDAVLSDVLDNYCIDTSRLFATGHSSGAQMVVQMLCNGEKRFKAVAPVAASKYCAKLPPVAVMYIQGMKDAQRGGGNGADVVSVFSASNGCGTSSTPKSDVMSCNSTFDRMPVTPGCVTYEGCMQPTVWCSHNDNGYNNTDGRQHGWPCFASTAIADFFASVSH